MEAIFEIHLLYDDVVNTVLDILLTIVTLGIKKGITAAIKAAFEGGWVEKIYNSVNYGSALMTIVSDIVKIFETLGNADELEAVPACEFDKLKDDHYEHPGDGKDF
jgi:hypothetical protein